MLGVNSCQNSGELRPTVSCPALCMQLECSASLSSYNVEQGRTLYFLIIGPQRARVYIIKTRNDLEQNAQGGLGLAVIWKRSCFTVHKHQSCCHVSLYCSRSSAAVLRTVIRLKIVFFLLPYDALKLFLKETLMPIGAIGMFWVIILNQQ